MGLSFPQRVDNLCSKFYVGTSDSVNTKKHIKWLQKNTKQIQKDTQQLRDVTIANEK